MLTKIDPKQKKREKIKKRDKKEKKDKIYKKEKKDKKKIKQNAIYKSIKQNYIFYVVMLLCLFSFSKCTYNPSNFFITIFSLIFITLHSYCIHVAAHYLDTHLSDTYKTYDNNFTRNTYLNWLAKKTIDFSEFHVTTHHNSAINKTYKNIILELINNIVTNGVIIIILKYFLALIDNRVILLWALSWASAHNINYNISSEFTHQQHHNSNDKNYGIDILDIFFDSKYDLETIETHNHAAINLIIVTTVILFCSCKFKL